MYKIIFVVLFLASCSGTKVNNMPRSQVKDYAEIGSVYHSNVRIKEQMFNTDKIYNPDEADQNINFSCFRDGYKNIVNYYDILTDAKMDFLRLMFFPRKAKYSRLSSAEVINDDMKTKAYVNIQYDYSFIRKSCVFIDANGNYMPVTTDKIIFAKE